MYQKKFCREAVLLVLTVFFAMAVVTPVLRAGKIQLPEDTELKLQFASGMKISSGNVSPGIPLLVYLAEPVKIGGKVIIEEGAEGKAEVLETESSSRPGKPGYIRVGFVELSPRGEYDTADGSPIKLKGEIEFTGKGRKLLSYLFIFGLFIKGTQGEVPVDAVYTAEVAETVVMQSE